MLGLNELSVIAFVLILAILLWKDRKNIERDSIIFVRRTKKGIQLLDKIAKSHPVFWRRFSNAGIVVGTGGIFVMFFFIAKGMLDMFFMPNTTPALGLVLPTISTQASMGPGYFLIPFWFWIIAIATVIVAHEMMHGIIGRNENFPIKSVGLILLGILPGAFVEPEGEDMLPDKHAKDAKAKAKKSKKESAPWMQGSWISRLRVLAAGSFSNIVLGSLVFLITLLLFNSSFGVFGLSKIYSYEGVTFGKVEEGSPAELAGLTPNSTIIALNNYTIKTLEDLYNTLRELKVNQTAIVHTTKSSYELTLGSRELESEIIYKPAVVDYVLASLESTFPGIIDNYNSISPEYADLRWRWIKESGKFPQLEKIAEAHITPEKHRKLKEVPYLGIGEIKENVKVVNSWEPYEPIILVLTNFLFYIAFLNIGIGLANMLPVKPLDGGYMIEIYLERLLSKKRASTLIKLIRNITLIMIILIFLFMGLLMVL